MTWNPPPVESERDALATHLHQLHGALRNSVHGLTDELARSTPTQSTISLRCRLPAAGATLVHR